MTGALPPGRAATSPRSTTRRCPPARPLAVRAIAAAAAPTTGLPSSPTTLWCRVVYDFAVTHHRRRMPARPAPSALVPAVPRPRRLVRRAPRRVRSVRGRGRDRDPVRHVHRRTSVPRSPAGRRRRWRDPQGFFDPFLHSLEVIASYLPRLFALRRDPRARLRPGAPAARASRCRCSARSSSTRRGTGSASPARSPGCASRAGPATCWPTPCGRFVALSFFVVGLDALDPASGGRLLADLYAYLPRILVAAARAGRRLGGLGVRRAGGPRLGGQRGLAPGPAGERGRAVPGRRGRAGDGARAAGDRAGHRHRRVRRLVRRHRARVRPRLRAGRRGTRAAHARIQAADAGRGAGARAARSARSDWPHV